jgi:hypothetical protein
VAAFRLRPEVSRNPNTSRSPAKGRREGEYTDRLEMAHR